MQAFILDKYGKGSALRRGDLATPALADTDVLVRIHASAVNQLDSKIRDGAFKPILPYKLPLVLGHDLAGVVIDVGLSVKAFKPGDEVFARVRDGRIGTFAEQIAVDEQDLALKPASWTMEEAASVPLVGLTAWQALVDIANVQKGQKVFIQAGSGGVGTIAIQLAKHLGATVATTTSTANIALVKSLGADIVIDYRTQNFEQVLSGYDVVLHSQDRDSLGKSIRILRPDGIAISISGPPDPDFAAKLGLNPVLKFVLWVMSRKIRKAAKAAGVGYRFLFMSASGKQLGKLADLLDTGALRPVVEKVFPFEQTNEAIAYVESGRAKGKIVVQTA